MRVRVRGHMACVTFAGRVWCVVRGACGAWRVARGAWRVARVVRGAWRVRGAQAQPLTLSQFFNRISAPNLPHWALKPRVVVTDLVSSTRR